MKRSILFGILVLATQLIGSGCAKGDGAADDLQKGTAETGEYTLHDDRAEINCDVAHVKVPAGWGVEGKVQWNLSVMMPGKWFICAANLKGPELWIRYPGQTFVWRDNFNLLGVNFQLHPGDADPALGEEIEKPLGTATQCIKDVIIPRFRKDIEKADVISSDEMTPEQARKLADAQAGDVMNSPESKQIQITPKGATVRVEYELNGKKVQEEIRLLALYLDFPSNNGVVHVWCIPYCTSFRAEKGRLDEQEKSVARAIDESLKADAKWNEKRDDVVKNAAQVYGDKMRELAQAVESNVIANMNRNIFDMCQQSYHKRMDMEQQTFHNIDNAIVGRSDYVTADGKIVEAEIAPLGQSAWRDGSGQVKFFNNGVNPNGTQPGTYEELTEK